jgi:hypothetical protein
MFRGLLRVMFSRVGRTLLILFALAVAWGLWWVWPERPLRELAFTNVSGSARASVSGDGKSIKIVDRNKERAHVVRCISPATGIEIQPINDLNPMHHNPPWIAIPSRGTGGSSLAGLPHWLRRLLAGTFYEQSTINIHENPSLSISRRIPSGNCCGFAENNRAWTQHSSGPQLILREWDVSYPQAPWWLWLSTGALSLAVIAQWLRASRVRQDPVAESPRN